MTDTAKVKKDSITWFEIPTADLDCATEFYKVAGVTGALVFAKSGSRGRRCT